MTFLPRRHRQGGVFLPKLLATVLLCLLSLQLLSADGTLLTPFAVPQAEAAAGINPTIHYQGKLSAINGAAVSNGSYNVRFKIFNAATGGSPLWTETWSNATTRVTMTGGLFSVALGTHTTMTGSVDFNQDSLYLQVEFDPGNDGTYEETFSPRRRFSSVPYAHNANTLDGLDSSKFVRKDQPETMSGSLTINQNGSPQSTIGLKIIQTASGAHLHGEKTLSSSGTLVWEGSASGASLYVASSLQGAGLTDCDIAGSSKLLWDAATGRFSCGTDQSSGSGLDQNTGDARYVKKQGDTMTGALTIGVTGGNNATIGLKVINQLSGSYLHAEKSLTSSGTLTWEGAASGATLYVATSINGAGLTDCDLSSQALKWDATTGRFSCGTVSTGNWSGTGALQTYFDNRFVNTSGDTMTGALTVGVTGGNNATIGLKIIQTASGAHLHGEKTLSSSGTLVWEGSASGASLYVASSLQGAGLTDCDIAGSSKLLWDAATGRFSCGTDQSSGSGLDQNTGDARYVKKQGDTMTGALTINVTNGTIHTIGLKVINTFSGAIVQATQQLRSSGSLTVEGNATVDGGTLHVDAANDRVGIGTASPTAAFHIYKNTDDLYTLLEGNAVTLTSGVWNNGSNVAGFSPGNHGFYGTQTNHPLDIRTNNLARVTVSAAGLVGIGTTNPGGGYTIASDVKLHVSSGGHDLVLVESSGIYDSGVAFFTAQTSNDAAIFLDQSDGQKLKFSVGTVDGDSDRTGNTAMTIDQNKRVGIGVTSPDSALDVLGTISGSVVTANTLRSSGSLVWEGAASGATLYVATSINGAGLTDCDLSSQALKWDVTTGRFSCGIVSTGNWSGTGALQSYFDNRFVNTSGDTMTGALTIGVTGGNNATIGLKVINQLSGSYLHAEKSLSSSGTLVWEGFGSGARLHVSGLSTFSGALRLESSLTGATIFGFGLPAGGCSNATTSKLLWDASTGKFSCGTDQNSGGGSAWSNTGALQTYFDNRFVNTSGDTMTGALVINVTGGTAGTLGLRVLNTVSGAILHAERTLSSSGQLIVESTSTRGSGALTIIQNSEFGTGSYMTASGAPILVLDNYTNNSANAGIVFGNRGTFDTTLYRAAASRLQTDGSLYVLNMASGSYLHAEKGLSSSGTLVWEGVGSGSSLFLAGGNITVSRSGAVVFNENSKPVDLRMEGDNDASLFFLDASADRIGIGTALPRTRFSVVGVMSGSHLTIQGTMSGRALVVMGTGANVLLRTDRSRGLVNIAGTMSGQFVNVMGAGGASADTEVARFNSAGATSHPYITVGSTDGGGFFLYDKETSRARLGLHGGSSYAFEFGSTGSVVHAKGASTSPLGAFSVISTGSTTLAFVVRGASDQGMDLQQWQASDGTVLARMDLNGRMTISPNGGTGPALNVLGTVSGSALTVSGLQNCDSLDTDASGNVVCGTDSGAGGGLSQADGDERYVNVFGDTMTGTLTIAKMATGALVSVSTDANPRGVVIQGRYAYVLSVGSDTLQVFDITFPLFPSLVSTTSVGDGPHHLVVAGRYAYVVNYNDDTFQAIDVSDPNAPVVLSTAVVGDGPIALAVQGRYAYVTNADADTLSVLDITDPRTLVTLPTVALGDRPHAISVQGRYGVVVNHDGSTLLVLDLADPAAPTVVGSMSTNAGPVNVAFRGRYAYVADYDADVLEIVDVSDPASPASVGSVSTGDSPHSVTVSGRYAYVTMREGNTIQVFDIDNPSSPSLAGTVPAGDGPVYLAFAGRYAYVTDYDDATLQAYDFGAAYIQLLEAGDIEATALSVRGGLQAMTADFRGAVVLGGGFLASQPSAVTVAQRSATALTVRNTGGGSGLLVHGSGAVLVLDSYRQSPANPHIVFGYRGYFDVSLARTSTGGLTVASRGGVPLTIDSETETLDQNLFMIFSDAANSSYASGGPDENLVFRVQADGQGFADGPFTTAGADYAEYFYASTNDLAFGDAVCLDVTRPSTVERCASAADPNVVGFVSSTEQAAFIGNRFGGAEGLAVPGTALVGLLGQLQAKVRVESGAAIRIGDQLTPSSKPGFVRKALAGEPTVGVAMQPLEKGEGRIQVLVARKNSSLTAEAVSDRVLETIKDLKIEDEIRIGMQGALDSLDLESAVRAQVSQSLSSSLSTTQDRIASLERAFASLSGALLGEHTEDSDQLTAEYGLLARRITELERHAGSGEGGGGFHASGTDATLASLTALTAETLALERSLSVGTDARIAGDLYLDGTFHVQDLFIPGALTIDGTLKADRLEAGSGSVFLGNARVAGDLEVAGRLSFASGSTLSLDRLLVRNGLAVIGDVTIGGIAVFLRGVQVKGELVVSNRQAGYARIPRSGTSVTILFSTGFVAVPVVTATPNGRVDGPWWLTPASQTGFTIHLADPAAADTAFSWLALATENPLTAQDDGAHGAAPLPFPVDAQGVPLSSNDVWNACIRGTTTLDADGQPLSCSRYHDRYTWEHPDVGISFLWNTAMTPPLLVLPEGYLVEVREEAASSEASQSSEGSAVSAVSVSSTDSAGVSSSSAGALSSWASSAVSSADGAGSSASSRNPEWPFPPASASSADGASSASADMAPEAGSGEAPFASSASSVAPQEAGSMPSDPPQV